MALDPKKPVTTQFNWARANDAPSAAESFAALAQPQTVPEVPVAEVPQAPQIMPRQPTPLQPQAPQAPSLTEQKQADIPMVAAMKAKILGGETEAQRQIIGLQEGNEAVQNTQDYDLNSLPYNEFAMKYGKEAADQRYKHYVDQGAVIQEQTDGSLNRTVGEKISDTTVAVGQGLTGLATSALALGGAALGGDVGVTTAQWQEDSSNWFEEQKSDALSRQLDYGRVKDSLDTEDNAIQQRRDISNGDSEMLAGFKKVGRDFLSTGKNILTDPSRLVDTGIQVIGQLALTGGIGAAVRGASLASGLSSLGAKKMAERAVAAFTGSATGGDAYASAVSQVLNKTEAELREDSPEYNRLRASGIDHENAVIELAHSAGLVAASVGLPVGLVAGKALAKFEANPMATGVAGVSPLARGAEALRTGVLEGTQETFEEGSAQFGANLGVRQSGVNPNQDLTENVGMAAAEGAAGGIGGVAALRGPGVAAKATVGAIKGVVGGIGKGTETAAKATEIAKEAVVQTNKKAQTQLNVLSESIKTAPVLTPEEGLNQINKTFVTSEKEIGDMSDEVASIYWPADKDESYQKNKLQGLQDLAVAVDAGVLSEEGKAEALLFMQSNMKYMDELLKNQDSEAVVDTMAKAGLNMATVNDTMKVVKGSKAMKDALNQKLTPAMVDKLTTVPEDATDAQVNKAANATIQAGLLDTKMVDPKKARLLLNHTTKEEPTPENLNQKKNLEFLTTTLEEIDNFEKTSTLNSNQKMRNRLIHGRKNIANDPSLVGLVQGIIGNLQNNNSEGAQKQMARLAFFREGQRQKLQAIENSKANDGKVFRYSVLQPFGWSKADTDKGGAEAYYTPGNENSEIHLNTVRNELNLLNKVYDNMKATYPELTSRGSVKSSELNSSSKSTREPARTVTTAPVVSNDPKIVVSRDAKGRGNKTNKNIPERAHFDENGQVKDTANPVTIDGRSGRAIRYQATDLSHAKKATKYIGSGIKNGTTDSYRVNYGDRANVKDYTSEDVVFVKTDWNTKNGMVGVFDRNLVNAAVNAGATILMDRKSERDQPRNEGARNLHDFLIDRGYVRQADGVMVPMSAVGMAPVAAVAPAVKPPVKPPVTPTVGQRTSPSMQDTLIEVSEQLALDDEADAQAKIAAKERPYKPRKGTVIESGDLVQSLITPEQEEAIQDKIVDNITRNNRIPRSVFTVPELKLLRDVYGAKVTSANVIMPGAEVKPSGSKTKKVVVPKVVVPEAVTPKKQTLKLYHGTNKEFDEFQDGEVYWTNLPGLAFTFAVGDKSSSPRVIEANVTLEKPMEMSSGKVEPDVFSVQNKVAIQKALETHDGVIIKSDDGAVMVISTSNAQVQQIKPKPKDEVTLYPSLRLEQNPVKLSEEDRAKMALVVPLNEFTAQFYEAYQPNNSGSLFTQVDPDGINDSPVRKIKDYILSKIKENSAPDYFWSNILNVEVPKIQTALNRNLQMQLNDTEFGTTNKEKLEKGILDSSGKPIMAMGPHRNLNFIEKVGDKYQYTKAFSEIASLAFVHWLMTETGPIPGTIEDADAANTFNVPLDMVTGDMIDAMEAGTFRDGAVNRLAVLLESFMGVKPVKDISRTDAAGMMLGMAATILDATSQDRTIDLTSTDVNNKIKVEKKQQNSSVWFNRDRLLLDMKKEYVVVTLGEMTKGQAYEESWVYKSAGKQELLLDAVTPDAERMMYIGKPPEESSRTQLRNKHTPLSKEQIKAQDASQNKPHFVNEPLLFAINGLGEDLWQEIMGYNLDAENYKNKVEGSKIFNQKDLSRIDGQNLSVRVGFESMMDHSAAVFNYAIDEGVSLSEVPVFMGTDTTVVGRFQERGTGPVADKQMRQLITPTPATIDMTNDEDANRFWLAIAQAWGLKTEQDSRVSLVNRVIDMVEDPHVQKASDLLREMLIAQQDDQSFEMSPENREAFRSLLVRDNGSPLFPDQPAKGFDALLHMTRLAMASEDEAKSFKVTLAMEADGKTDGPIHAAENFSRKLTGKLLKVLSLGGKFTNQYDMTLNKAHMSMPAGQKFQDLYMVSSDLLSDNIYGRLGKMGDANGPMSSLMAVMGLMDMKFNFDPKTGILTINRNLLKNPLTVSVYGAGLAGIADKIVREIMQGVYAEMTKMANENNSQAYLEKSAIYQHLIDLTEKSVVLSKKGIWYSFPSKIQPLPRKTTKTPENFVMSSEQLGQFSMNVKTMMATSMVEAIQEMMGDTRDTMSQLQIATQVQGLVITDLFNQEVNKVKAERLDSGLLRRSSDELSENDYNDILQKVMPFGAVIRMPTQTANLSMVERNSVSPKADDGAPNKKVMAKSYSGRFQADLPKSAPSDPGVKVAPYLTIMTGDGQMIMRLAIKLGADGRALFVYDGVEMAVDKIDEYGKVINEVVAEGWRTNYVRFFANSFEQFKNLGISDKLSEDGIIALKTMLLENGIMYGENQDIDTALNRMTDDLYKTSFDIEARKNVTDRYGFSVDHMAGAEQPYVNEKPVIRYDNTFPKPTMVPVTRDELIADTEGRYSEPSYDDLASYLEPEILAEVKRLSGERKQVILRKEQKEREAIVNDKSFMKTLTEGVKGITAMEKRPSIFKANARTLYTLTRRMDRHQRLLMNSALKVIKKTGFNFYFGNTEDLTKLRNEQNGAFINSAPIDLGQINLIDKSIYIASGSIETLVHESVHAATMNQLYAVLTEPENVTEATKDAVARLQILMDEFMEIDFTMKDNPEHGLAAQRTIQSRLEAHGLSKDPLHMAAAISEMLAWTLSNQPLIEQMKQTRVKSKAAMIAYKVMKALAQLLGFAMGDLKTNDYKDSMFTALRFNAQILMRDSTTVNRSLPILLNHSTLKDVNDLRVIDLKNKFHDNLKAYFKDQTDPAYEASSFIIANQITDMFKRNGFQMDSEQEQLFAMIQNAFRTTMDLDKQALNRAHELHKIALKNLSVDALMKDRVANNPNDRDIAQKKYNALTGSKKVWKDESGRTNLLSSFLAATMIDPELNNFLKNLPSEDQEVINAHPTENKIDFLGEGIFDYFSDKLNRILWDGYKDKDVATGIENLMDRLSVIQERGESNVERMVFGMDALLNEKLADFNQKAAHTALEGLRKAASNSGSRSAKIGLYLAYGAGSVFSKKHGEEVADFITHALNGERMWTPLREFFSEIRGTTSANERIHELVNKVRGLVSQSRQQHKDAIPHTLSKKFSRKLTKDEWATLSRALGKFDVGNLLTTYTAKDIAEIMSKPTRLQSEIQRLENEIRTMDKRNSVVINRKINDLAYYMMTGKTKSTALLTNAYAISKLLGENRIDPALTPDPKFVQAIDDLIGLKALGHMAPSDLSAVNQLFKDEFDAMELILLLMANLDYAERNKTNSLRAKYNAVKGRVDTVSVDMGSVIIDLDSNAKNLGILSYKRIGDYTGPHQTEPMGYYYSPVSGQSTYHQGAMQTVQKTMYGVDALTGFRMNSGGIAFSGSTAKTFKDSISMSQKDNLREDDYLHPVWDEKGNILAYERSMNPEHLSLQNYDDNLSVRLGAWKGRQEEERLSFYYNRELVDVLFDKYRSDFNIGIDNESYVNLADPKQRDKVTDHIWKVIPDDMKAHIKLRFGDVGFMVRRDMVNDALGYPGASIGDMFTGKSRMPKLVQKTIADSTRAVFGDKAYQYLVMSERGIQTVVTAAKVTIVIKSVIVPISNIVSNFYQLMMNGVPMSYFGKRLAEKVKETNTYVSNRARQAEIGIELAAYKGQPQIAHRLQAEYTSLEDANRRMSIWPLVQKGEFNTITDSLSEADRVVHTTQIFDKIEEKLEQLPGRVKDLAQYAYVSRNTSLFKLLNRTTQYGDFLAKALLMDHMMENQKKTQEEAYKVVRNEFVNYNLLPGRMRTFLESTGVIWFWNFKIRSMKVALRIMQDNPLKALVWSNMASSVIAIPGMDNTVLADNFATKLWDGSVSNSTGPGMSQMLLTSNPWYRLTN